MTGAGFGGHAQSARLKTACLEPDILVEARQTQLSQPIFDFIPAAQLLLSLVRVENLALKSTTPTKSERDDERL